MYEMKKANLQMELNPKRRFNIGKLIKSVENGYDCRVSRFDEADRVSTEDETTDESLEKEDDYYEIDLDEQKKKMKVTDKRNGKIHLIDIVEFQSFLENKLDFKLDSSDKDTAITEDSQEEKKFHFLKFEMILREFYQKNQVKNKFMRKFRTNENFKKRDPLFSEQKTNGPKTYQGGKYTLVSPVIKKNLFQDHKQEIDKLRRKTMVFDKNIIDELRTDLSAEKKLPNTQAAKMNPGIEETKESSNKQQKISSFSENIEESKDNNQSDSKKNSLKNLKRTSIFDMNKISAIIQQQEEDEDDNASQGSQEPQN